MEQQTAIIEVDAQNLDSEHICCALGADADAKAGTARKKAWMSKVFEEGYRFHRLDARGKAFIETVPGQNAWAPIVAPNWLYIECFWVSGGHKGQGHAKRLLQTAIARAKAEKMNGLCALGSAKKQHFLSDPGFYRHHGFVQADEFPPYFQLLALPLTDGAELPRFKAVETLEQPALKGVHIWYSHHCPHTEKYVGLLRDTAQQLGTVFTQTRLETRLAAQNAPCPFTTWAMFYDGAFVTNEVFSEKKFTKFIQDKMGA